MPEVATKARGGGFLFHLFLFLMIFAAGVILMIVAYRGHSYYGTPLTLRHRSEVHQQFKPGGHTGHALGITGSAMLVGLLSYSFRKRVRMMRNRGKLSYWLQFHIFLGIAGPAFITLHTAFKLRGIVAISYWSMILVFLSGIIGRYLYAQIPHALSGKELERKEMEGEIQHINRQLAEVLTPEHHQQVQAITEFHSSTSSPFLSIFAMLADDFSWIRKRYVLRKILKTCGELPPSDISRTVLLARKCRIQTRRIYFLRASQNLFRHWHIIHLPLAQTMYLTMLIHIMIAIMTGYF